MVAGIERHPFAKSLDPPLHSDMNKAVSLNKKLNKTENNKYTTNESFLRKKNVSVYQEMDEESDEIFGDMVKQISLSKSFPRKIKFCFTLKGSSLQD